MTMSDQRPVHLEVDCATGKATRTPLTDDEWNERRAAEAQAVADEQARASADAQLCAAVAAHPDPIVRELAARLGLGK